MNYTVAAKLSECSGAMLWDPMDGFAWFLPYYTSQGPSSTKDTNGISHSLRDNQKQNVKKIFKTYGNFTVL